MIHTLKRSVGHLWWAIAAIVFGSVMVASSAQAGTYTAYDLPDFTATMSDTTAGATSDVTVTFTMPADMSTDGSFTLSTPYVYSYAGGVYTYDSLDITYATITSNELTVSWQGDSYVSFYPTASLVTGQTVTINISGAINPEGVEGTGTFSLSGYEYIWTADYSDYDQNDFSGSQTQVFGEIDLIVTVTDADGITPVSDVYVYLSWYSDDWSSYESYNGTTDSDGKAYFSGLTSGNSYDISFSYYGSDTTNSVPANSTVTYAGTPGQAAAYAFAVPNLITHWVEDDGVTPIADAYWYAYKTDYTNWDEYVWVYGYTDSLGTISGSVTLDGSYELGVYDANWNYYTFDFTVSGGVVSGLADPIEKPIPEVTGTVTAGGLPVSSAYVYVHDEFWSTYRGAYTDVDGNFEIAVGETGTFYLEIDPWGLPQGYFPPAATQIAVTSGVPGSALTIELAVATKAISGEVSYNGDTTAGIASGTPVTDAYVYAYQVGGSYGWAYSMTDSNGQFEMPVTGGLWYVYIYQSSWPSTWAYSGETLQAEFQNDSTEETAEFHIHVDPYNSDIIGSVQYPDGSPVGESAVWLYAWGGENGNIWSYSYTDANGAFDIPVTEGSFDVYGYFYSMDGSNIYSFPNIETQSLSAGETVDLGVITLDEKTSHIQGSILLRSTGEGVADQYVYAWRTDGSWEWAWDTTDSTGAYDLVVGPGDWMVYIYTWGLQVNGQDVVYTGGGKSVTIADDETVAGQDFNLDITDATMNFLAQDSSGNTLDSEYGWVSVYEADGGDYGWYSIGCYVDRGNCETKVASGVEYSVTYYSYSAWGWGGTDTDTYTYTGMLVDGAAASTVTLGTNETQDVVLNMALNDVTVSGSFLDENGDAAYVYGGVYATNNYGAWAYTDVYGESEYSLALSAGTWIISYWTYGDWWSYGYGGSVELTVASGEEWDQDFYVLDSSATISGTVLDPDGNPVTTPTFVKASTSYGTANTETEETYGLISQTTYTDESGNFSMNLPSGTYFLTAASSEYLDPQPVEVTADTVGSAEGVVLQFVASDATISGNVSDGAGITMNAHRILALGDGVEDAYVYAYSSTGSAVNTATDEYGNFELPATLGTWYVGAVHESNTVAYFSALSEVTVDEATETLNLSLTDILDLPEGQTVQFDPQDATVITLENGVEINIPANAITSEDIAQVTVVVTPKAEIAHEPGQTPLSIGYQLTVTDADGNPITTFAGDVTITIPYTDAELTDAGVTEDDLTVGYYEDQADAWQETDGVVVVNEDENEFIITTDHFSLFSIMSSQSAAVSGDEDGGVDGDEETAPGEETPVDGVLGVPTDLDAGVRKAHTLKVSWVGDGDAASYRVRVVNPKTDKTVKIVSASSAEKVVKKLKSNKLYQFSVRSVGSTVSKSAWSEVLVARTKPGAPKNLRVKRVSTDEATLKWDASRGVLDRYLVTLYDADKQVIRRVKTKKTRLLVENLDAGTKYSFRVRSKFNKKNISTFSKRKVFTTDIEVVQ